MGRDAGVTGRAEGRAGIHGGATGPRRDRDVMDGAMTALEVPPRHHWTWTGPRHHRSSSVSWDVPGSMATQRGRWRDICLMDLRQTHDRSSTSNKLQALLTLLELRIIGCAGIHGGATGTRHDMDVMDGAKTGPRRDRDVIHGGVTYGDVTVSRRSRGMTYGDVTHGYTTGTRRRPASRA
jgi:hypothetical protein